MFFALSKVLGFLATPSNAIALIGCLGLLLLLTRFRRLATGLLATSVALVAVCGLSPLGDALMLPLSERFPPWQQRGNAPVGIVVLGGAISPGVSAARDSVELNAAAERMTAVAELARRFPQARIVFTGGGSNLFGTGAGEAKFAGQLFESFGIASSRVLLEYRSRTTGENAIFTRDLVKPAAGETWLLVTSAYHMPRAIAVFRRAGFPVEAYPVDFRTRGWEVALTPFNAVSAGLARTDTAMHEWLGLIAYRLSGRSAELLPRP